MPDAPRPCDSHLDLIRFKYPLTKLAEALKLKRKIKVVAIGSSSTAGEGNIVPFPNRLEAYLRYQGRFHGTMIDVINRGVGGQEAMDELSRFEVDVLGEAPTLVIWQVGTNAVFRLNQYNFADVAVAIDKGIEWARNIPADVVLMDLQYTTAIICPKKLPSANDMVKLISDAADKAGINVFRRFALMERWYDNGNGIPMTELVDPIDPDHLHMSDWCTGCVSQALCDAITNPPAMV
jgi:acyl-CoA thioesterase-1